MPGQAWEELRGRGFRTDRPRSSPWLFDIAPVPGREVTASELPSAPMDHAPATDDFPPGWTVQSPRARIPAPTTLTCALCGATDDAVQHPCPALSALSAPG